MTLACSTGMTYVDACRQRDGVMGKNNVQNSKLKEPTVTLPSFFSSSSRLNKEKFDKY